MRINGFFCLARGVREHLCRADSRLASLVIGCALAGVLTAAPSLHVATPVFDFGTRDSAGIVTNTFVLQNRGDQSLLITGTKESCGCTVSELGAQRIEPGAATILTIRMNLQGMSGPVKKYVHIVSNDPKRVSTLTLEGTAMARVALEPPSLSMGRIDPRHPPAPARIRLAGYVTNAVITGIVCDTNIFKVVRADDGRSLTVHPPLEKCAGALKQSVIITTSDETSPRQVLSIFAYISSPIRYTPRSITVSPKDDNGKRWIMLKPGTAGKFNLLNAELSAPFASVRIDTRPDSSFHVILSEIQTGLIGPESALTLTTDNPEQPQIVIPIRLLND